jgi:hypothetical protein
VLFHALLILVVMLPCFEDSTSGEIVFASVNTLLVLVAVAANGRSPRLFWLAFLLAVPALGLRTASFVSDHHAYLTLSWVFCAAVMAVTIVRLLGDIFQAGAVTRDRLFACATTFLMLGLLWCYLYALVEEFSPGSFTGMSQTRSLHVADMAYFSFNVVTSVALTPVLPVSKWAQVAVILQEFASVLYMSFVISRLVGMYAPVTPSPKAPA